MPWSGIGEHGEIPFRGLRGFAPWPLFLPLASVKLVMIREIFAFVSAAGCRGFPLKSGCEDPIVPLVQTDFIHPWRLVAGAS